jgi:hypothetical protein
VDREQGTGNREQRTENREQRTENREQRTENREQIETRSFFASHQIALAESLPKQVLYQGMALAMPKKRPKSRGFNP